MRCGLSPIVAMRKTKGLFIVGNKKGFAIYWEFLPFFSVFPGKVNRFTANPRHFPWGILALPLFPFVFPGESEPFCREFEALSPSLPQPTQHTTPNTRSSAPAETTSAPAETSS